VETTGTEIKEFYAKIIAVLYVLKGRMECQFHAASLNSLSGRNLRPSQDGVYH
jgi:hypothetical protein